MTSFFTGWDSFCYISTRKILVCGGENIDLDGDEYLINNMGYTFNSEPTINDSTILANE